MLEQLLSALIPRNARTPAARRIWSVACLLFPLALVAGCTLLIRNAPHPPVTVSVNCAKAAEIARQFLIREGAPAGPWRSVCGYKNDNNLVSFSNASPDRAPIWRVAPPIAVSIKFSTREGAQAEVDVSVDGRVIGFKRENTGSLKSTASREEAEAIARAHLPTGIDYSEPSVFDNGKGSREFSFRSSRIPDARVTTQIRMQGRTITSMRSDVSVGETDSPGEMAQTALSVAGGIFACFVALFSIYRYASRTLQQEVSHRRSLIVALLCGGFAILLGFNAIINNGTVSVSLSVVLLVFAIMGVFGGALVAAAYGSGEGDVREAFPGKLTSLDAILTGRVFSRNAGVSILFGMVWASWLILALGLVTWPFRSNVPFASTIMAGPYIRFGWLMPFVTYPLLSLGVAAAGLMQPISFLQRNVPRKRRWHMPVLVLCTGLACLMRTHSPSTVEFLLSTLAFVVAVLAPFFLCDLFATLISFAMVISVQGMANSLAAVPLFSTRSLAGHIIVALGATCFAIAAILRGKQYEEEEVRPLYARHIAERKALEAEVSAAREAQLRLLPEAVPRFAGLHISAICVPAETVGGDFYDFFPLGQGRLGVFLAEGNNRGLAAALTIALAKGYLMQCVERFQNPVDILTQLEAALCGIFTAGEAGDNPALTEFAFAAIDTVRGQIHYARTGTYPKIVVARSEVIEVNERILSVAGRRAPITEGHANLAPGDHVVLFTDGIGRRLAAGNRRPEEAAAALISKIAPHAESAPDNTCERFLSATRAPVDPDDLTLVVIRMQALAESIGSNALEAVA